MYVAILLILTASLFTAISSVFQKIGVNKFREEGALKKMWLMLKTPIWLFGNLSLMLGYLLQVAALHFGSLSLVQPLFSAELIFVYVILVLSHKSQAKIKEVFYPVIMASGLAGFLLIANPRGGARVGFSPKWLVAGGLSYGISALISLGVIVYRRRNRARSPMLAAILGITTGVSWGFLSALTKEFSYNLGSFRVILSAWSFYGLVVLGTLSVIFLTEALSAGPLAASQPGLTLGDPLAATIIGIYLFRERINDFMAALGFEIFFLVLVAIAVVKISKSKLLYSSRSDL